ncbi:hypothetical protein [Streptomyces sp. CBMA123]|uniref:hypothetical protein n=1 Tax=Streptomyces sp. CBMA123 TaxID=1896313 RepID=UPI001662136D|nr:hypothetical protein [Streptomyces sp. CBMA123]MBD0689020.1 hypothetical protein [Streptomyces sp. CBMA123]
MRASKSRVLLLALALPLLAAAPAAASSSGALRPVPLCGEDTPKAHHRPLPAPGLAVGEPVRRNPARPCP